MMQPKADADFYAELLKRCSGASRRKEKGCKRTLYELAVAPLAPAASNRGWYFEFRFMYTSSWAKISRCRILSCCNTRKKRSTLRKLVILCPISRSESPEAKLSKGCPSQRVVTAFLGQSSHSSSPSSSVSHQHDTPPGTISATISQTPRCILSKTC